MRVSEEGLTEFRRIYQEEFGEELSEESARDMASRVLTLYEILARPI